MNYKKIKYKKYEFKNYLIYAFKLIIKTNRIFMVGVGALGCEYLKQFALMGVCCG